MIKQLNLFFQDFYTISLLIYSFLRGRIELFVNYQQSQKEEVVILANGPSLTIDIEGKEDTLKEKDLIVVNFAPLRKDFVLLKPKFLILADPAFWSQDISLDLKHKISKLNDALNDVNWDMIIYVPYLAKKHYMFFDSIISTHRFIKVEYYNNLSSKGGHIAFNHLLYNMGWLMPHLQNVLVGAIFLGIKMRYSRIKILGADHNWVNYLSVGTDNILYIEDHHAGEAPLLSPFYKDVSRTEVFKVHEILSTFSRTFSSYWLLRNYSSRKGIKIYNCSETSFIDAFERLKL